MSADCCGCDNSATDEAVAAPPRWWQDRSLLPAALSGMTLLLSVAGSGLNYPGIELVGAWFAVIAGGYTFVPGALRNVRRGRLGIGLLMTIAAVGAITLGQVQEAATLAFLFSLAETLEQMAMRRASFGLSALLTLLPEQARVRRGKTVQTVKAAEVKVGDLLVVGAGDHIATDGIVVHGVSHLDTSSVTGESMPRTVRLGDSVLAGCVNGSGTLEIEATADGADNSLTRLVEVVKQAHATKGERARFADRVARPLIPAILIVASLVCIFGFIVGNPQLWFERALVVLVAVSPCAMAISVPVTVISAIGAASRLGVVVKSGSAFEEMGTIRTIAFDKTGTLTRNEPAVTEVHCANGFGRDEVLGWAASVERSSSHPLARALINASDSTQIATQISEFAGEGVSGHVDNGIVRVGNPQWLPAGPLDSRVNDLTARGITVVVVHFNGQVAGVVGIRDELRDEVPATIALLRDMGIESLMVTGDHRNTAAALAAQAGIAAVFAQQTPLDKAQLVQQEEKYGPIAMIGDGINDSPALATARVGVAMGTGGTKAALQSADVAFTGHDLRLIPAAFAHARRGRHIMTTNIVLSLAIIVVLFPLALCGVLGLAGVVLVHEAAEVLVIANGMRAAKLPVSG